MTTAARLPQLPDVPTMVESGFAGFELGSWFGVLAPAGTPAAITARIDAAVQQIVGQPGFETRLSDLGAQRLVKGPKAFQVFIAAEFAKWGGVVKASGASLD